MYYNLWRNGEELPNPYTFNTNSLDDIRNFLAWEIVEFKYAEDTKNNISFYVWVNDEWETKFDDKYNIIFDSCQKADINKDTKSGEEWDAKEEDMWK